MVAVELTFADVEAVLLAMNHIAHDKRIAFRARLKHFQRLGFPKGANTGTGKRAVYTVRMWLQLCFALEFAQAGMSPARTVQILNDNWQNCEASLLLALTPDEHLDHWSPDLNAEDLVWMLSPEALRDLTDEGEGEFDYKEYIAVEPIDKIPAIMKGEISHSPLVGEFHRHFIIQLRPFLLRVVGLLSAVRPDCEHMEVFNSLQADLVADAERLKRLMAELEVNSESDQHGNP